MASHETFSKALHRPLSSKIHHRTELGSFFITRKVSVQKWGVRILQNFAPIRNEAEVSSKIMLQLQTLLFWTRKLRDNQKGGTRIWNPYVPFSFGLKSHISAVSDFKSLAKIVIIPHSTFTLSRKSLKIYYFYVFSPQIGRNFVILQRVSIERHTYW